MICLPRIAVLSCFGRETSLVNIMGPRSIFSSLFTHSIYFLLLLSSSYHYYPLSLAFDPLSTTRPERLTTSLNFVGSKVICICVQVQAKQVIIFRWRITCRTTYLSLSGCFGRQTLSSELGEICCYPTSHLPLGVTNEGREAIIISRTSSKFLAPLPGIPWRQKIGPDNRQFLAPLSGTPIFKIGELHTIFYLC